jgi:hypothetical protein
MTGVEAPLYLSPENSHVIESLSNLRQNGGKLSVTVPTFLRLIEACFRAEARVEDHLRLPLHVLCRSWSFRVQGKSSRLRVRLT